MKEKEKESSWYQCVDCGKKSLLSGKIDRHWGSKNCTSKKLLKQQSENLKSILADPDNRYARQKLARSAARFDKWTDVKKRKLKAYIGLCIIMGINTLPRIAMNWSSNCYIGNIGVRQTMTKNHFEEISQYMHFSDSTQEPQWGDDDYDRLFEVCRIMNMVLSNLKWVYDPSKECQSMKEWLHIKATFPFDSWCQLSPLNTA